MWDLREAARVLVETVLGVVSVRCAETTGVAIVEAGSDGAGEFLAELERDLVFAPVPGPALLLLVGVVVELPVRCRFAGLAGLSLAVLSLLAFLTVSALVVDAGAAAVEGGDCAVEASGELSAVDSSDAASPLSLLASSTTGVGALFFAR